MLAGLPALPMASEATLAEPARSQARYSGFQVPLEQIFDRDILAQELGWASGHLRIMCAHSEDGHIRSIKAFVGCNRAAHNHGSEIVLSFRDRAGATETLTLRPGQLSATARKAHLFGNPRDVELAVSLSRSG